MSISPNPGALRAMDIQKVFCYGAMGVAGLICLIFLLDAALGLLGRNLVLDILFLLAGGFVLWQGFETSRELR
jgi:hypothetical protein